MEIRKPDVPSCSQKWYILLDSNGNGISYSTVCNRILRNFLEFIPSHPRQDVVRGKTLTSAGGRPDRWAAEERGLGLGRPHKGSEVFGSRAATGRRGGGCSPGQRVAGGGWRVAGSGSPGG